MWVCLGVGELGCGRVVVSRWLQLDSCGWKGEGRDFI